VSRLATKTLGNPDLRAIQYRKHLVTATLEQCVRPMLGHE
jgi:hypothetical protein